MHRGLLRAAAWEPPLWEDGDAGEPLLTDAEPALHRRVAVSGPQRPAGGCRRGEVPGVNIGCGVGRAQRCVTSVRQRMVVCARCATSPSVRIVGGRRSRWPSRPATMSWAWPGSGGVFCRTVSSDPAQSALCSRASLWCEVAQTYQNGCPACRPCAHKPSWSHRRGIWLTTFAAPAGTPVVRSRSACRRR